MSGNYCICKHLLIRHFVDTQRCSQCLCENMRRTTMNDVSAISYGPCWCCGDTTSGGHWHGSADGGNVVEGKLPLRPNVTPYNPPIIRPVPLLLLTVASVPWWVGAWHIVRWIF